MGLMKKFIFTEPNQAYVNIRGIEIDKDLKKFVIRLNIYNRKGGNKYFVDSGDEYTVKNQLIIDACRGEAEKQVNKKEISKAIRAQVKEENRERRKNRTALISTQKTKRYIESAVEAETMRLMRGMGENRYLEMFEDMNNASIFGIAYHYIVTYVYKLKNNREV